MVSNFAAYTVPYRTVPTLCLKFYCRYRCKGVSKGDTVVEKKVNTTNCLGKNLFFGVRVKVSNVISHEKKGMAKSVVVNYRRDELRQMRSWRQGWMGGWGRGNFLLSGTLRRLAQKRGIVQVEPVTVIKQLWTRFIKHYTFAIRNKIHTLLKASFGYGKTSFG